MMTCSLVDFIQLCHDLLPGRVDTLLHFEVVCPRLAVLIEVGLGLEGETARLTRVGTLIGMGPHMFLKHLELIPIQQSQLFNSSTQH